MPTGSTTNSVCILDYGSGNVKSIYNRFSSLTPDVTVSNSCHDIEKSSHIVLPGVGSFGNVMSRIKRTLPLDTLENEVILHEKPFLGICVGMQVLAEKGHEFEEHEGLGWITGEVKILDSFDHPLPHIGWNDIKINRPSSLLAGIDQGSDFYFVNSYAFAVDDINNVVASTEYGILFTSVVQKNNIFGVQFHPEKSQRIGQRLLGNFLGIG